jgi:hypothetical protein
MVGSFTITEDMPIPTVASYSISKVALNMLTVKQALFYTDWIVVAPDPGIVKTDMNPQAPNAVKDVSTSIIAVVNNLMKVDSGSFVS